MRLVFTSKHKWVINDYLIYFANKYNREVQGSSSSIFFMSTSFYFTSKKSSNSIDDSILIFFIVNTSTYKFLCTLTNLNTEEKFLLDAFIDLRSQHILRTKITSMSLESQNTQSNEIYQLVIVIENSSGCFLIYDSSIIHKYIIKYSYIKRSSWKNL